MNRLLQASALAGLGSLIVYGVCMSDEIQHSLAVAGCVFVFDFVLSFWVLGMNLRKDK